ncbi:bifunctional [glutamine synthetase] adenylyltransferase/[glutamine synthetase]-adenylyl-L-tyrosine phosphorylase [Rhodococcus sp. X156]|uniref:bifunctional [glutamine synthetase] adenylyltransferase/[glutamine synthetase]-adenylyl-L-tyrosine phosphorylase n=1 Tax=Rhodococcus sp. X156 TaxID=2499145 RepID=UPI000FDB71C1|nr:bifunctional [glutamine synthetase] adenylyltransferase/[glutamine synthetase]-adenylyl-L-tyrosine phosphorylase [Rhodococcus sp. X156]
MTTSDRYRSALPTPGRLGLIDPGAADVLAKLGWTTDKHREVLWALSRSPDADLALRGLERLSESSESRWEELSKRLLTEKPLRGRLFGVLGSSTALSDHLVAHGDTWQLLAGEHIELPGVEQLQEELLGVVHAKPEPGSALWRSLLTGSDAVAALRTAYRDRTLVLAAADLAATVEDLPVLPYKEVGLHLANLADAALTAALAVAVAEVCGDEPCSTRLAVIAMGKCGARELNYVSDVDVIFVGEPADAVANRLAGAMVRIGSSAFFEVDAGLRPEGRSGALVRTVESHLAYYQRWAKTWEFQALLKARAMTGDMALGQEYIDAVSPMVWTASQREDFVPEVQAMRRRVEQNVPAELRDREIKLGSGSLRDVEFAVQLLQLVHGRFDEALHVQSTVDALGALSSSGYVGREDGANLTASYEFLRLLEHRLQLQQMRRTHTLPDPDDAAAMRWLARAAHVRPDGRTDAAGVLAAEIRRNAVRVRRLHQKLFYRPLLEAVARSEPEELRLSEDSAARQLAALGYTSPESALNHLRALTAGSSRRSQLQTVLLPILLGWLADTPNPDGGLLAYRRLSDALGETPWYLRTLRDEGAVAKRLMRVLGTSSYLPDLLIRAPEVLRLYADSPSGPRLLEVEPADVAQSLQVSAGRHRDPQRAVEAARGLRRHELARVASADLLGLLDVPQVCAALSSVWAAVLDAALSSVAAEARGDGEAPAAIAVIGMGRLGGAELGYGSDADVLFVCEPRGDADEQTAVRWASRVADKVRALLAKASSDPPLEVDTGLRPEGRSGPMVRTLSSYRSYYQQWSAPWEAQALLRARAVAGDRELGERFCAMVDDVRYPDGGVDAATIREIRRIKARVDSERLPRGADPATHTKLGRGGLADVEWTVQLLQLRFGHEIASLRTTSTLQALEAAGAAELLSAADAETLRTAWLTATLARNALVLVRGKPADQLPGPGRVLAAVATAAGWSDDDPGAFMDHYRKVTRRARGVVEHSFGT